MNGALCLMRALEAAGVDLVFGYPGGAIMPVYDALLDSSIRHILVRHEQGAAIAAEGYARATGKVGVCFATSGPGATNLVTGIADAFMDSVPMVAITGQVPSTVMGTDAFQEVDIYGITLPIVKHSFIVEEVADIASTIQQAFHIAASGRPGPVLVDLPKDIANAQCEFHLLENPEPETFELAAPEQSQIELARELLQAAQRPVVYAGGGIYHADAVSQFRSFVETTGIPTVHTLKGLGSLPADHQLCLGMLGMHGLKAANLAVQESDLLIVVGARFDDRATGKLPEFAPLAKVIHLDVDPAEMGKLRKPEAPVLGDLQIALPALSQKLELTPWRQHCLDMHRQHAWDYDVPSEKIYAPRLLRDLSLATDANTFITCDVGQHQMWVAQHYQFAHPRLQLTSGGLGTMGFGLPAAIGVQLGQPQSRVICVSGDGSIMMNIQELATIKRYQLPVKILLLDNQSLGLVRQWQTLFFKKRFSEIDLSDNPDFSKLAEAFDIPSISIAEQSQVPDAIRRLLHDPGPLLVHVQLDQQTHVWPLVPPGANNAVMLNGISTEEQD